MKGRAHRNAAPSKKRVASQPRPQRQVTRQSTRHITTRTPVRKSTAIKSSINMSNISNTLNTRNLAASVFNTQSNLNTNAQRSFITSSKNTITPRTSPSLAALVGAPKRFSHAMGYSHYSDAHDIEERIVELIKNLGAVDPSKVTPKSHFQKDLGIDSLSRMELIMMLEFEFEVQINDDDAVQIESIPEAVHYFSHTPFTTI